MTLKGLKLINDYYCSNSSPQAKKIEVFAREMAFNIEI